MELRKDTRAGFFNTLATIIVLGAVLIGVFFYWQYKNDRNLVCVQLRVKARNPLNGEIKEFGNTCDVPQGWEEVERQRAGSE